MILDLKEKGPVTWKKITDQKLVLTIYLYQQSFTFCIVSVKCKITWEQVMDFFRYCWCFLFHWGRQTPMEFLFVLRADCWLLVPVTVPCYW